MSASFFLQGTGVSTGIAIGRAQLVSHATFEVTQYSVEPGKLKGEFKRLDTAIADARNELEELRAEILAGDYVDDVEAFIDVQETLLNDSSLNENTKNTIAEHACNAEWALVTQMQAWVAQFDQIEDEYLRERKYDVMQVVERILKHLMGRQATPPEDARRDEQNIILVAHDLSPADLLHYKSLKLSAVVTDLGGITSHTAIIARSLGVPAIAGMRFARQVVHDNELLIVDGKEGTLIVSPSREIFGEYREHYHAQEKYRTALKTLTKRDALTCDGTPVTLLANIEMPEDLPAVHKVNADGVGLFRTEFLYLNQHDLPDEDTQFAAYKKILRRMKGQEVVFRTLDLGADKIRDKVPALMPDAPNPALGLRAIRLCFAEPSLFTTQLRAIFRASAFGKVKIMIPMLSTPEEIGQTFDIINGVKKQLAAENINFDNDVPVGAMIEVPSAALILKPFLENFAFLSIGTNDLIQYILAADRADNTVAYLYNATHPALLRLLKHVFKEAARADIPVSICGEIAGNPDMTRLLLGMGLTRFSMPASGILAVKERVLNTDIPAQHKLVNKILKTDDPIKVKTLIDKLNGS
jgi:phosphotransferase system enzyme I (PtsI)